MVVVGSDLGGMLRARLWLVVALSAASVGSGCAAGANPAPRGSAGVSAEAVTLATSAPPVIFVREQRLWIMQGDGTNQQLLAVPGAGVDVLDEEPAWSPDGSRIAFVRQRGTGYLHIFVVDSDGAGLRQVTNGRHHDTEPAWSPDGTRIVFVRIIRDKQYLYTKKLTSASRSHRLTAGESPAWSPNGGLIAFDGLDRTGIDQLYTIDPRSGTRRQLAARRFGLSAPDWSPDGDHIVAVITNTRVPPTDWQSDVSDIVVLRSDGSSLWRVTARHRGTDLMPAFAPGGRRLVFQRDTCSRDGMTCNSRVMTVPLHRGEVIGRGVGTDPDW